MNVKLVLRNMEKMIIHKVLLPAMYEFYRKQPVDEQLVLFADAKNAKIPFSMEAMYQEMINRGYAVENWCVNFDEFSIKNKLCYLRDFMKRYSQAKYVFICDYFLPVSSCRKKTETLVIQLWHSAGMLKKFGYDALDDLGNQKNLPGAKNIDLWPVSSDICANIVSNACHLYKNQVRPLGVTRTDVYFQDDFQEACRRNFYKKYPELKGKKLVLWAPTFRGNAKDGSLIGIKEIQNLQRKLSEDCYLLIKVHPHLEKKYQINNCDIITDLLYPVIDVLITDYSSTIFECYLSKKPFIIFAPDFDQYMDDRGFYIDYKKDLACKVVKTSEELEIEVEKVLKQDFSEFQNAYLDRHLEKCDGRAIEHVLNYLQQIEAN